MKSAARINFSILTIAAALSAASGAASARAADATAPSPTAALRDFSDATRVLYKQINAARIHVRLEQNFEQLVPPELRKDFEDWRAQTLKTQSPDDFVPMNDDGPATVLVRPGGRGGRNGRAPGAGGGPRAGGPANDFYQQRQENLMLLRRWVQERATSTDPETAARARIIIQRLEAYRANPSMEALGFIYSADGTAIVLASLPIDQKNQEKNTVNIRLPDNVESTATLIGSDAIRGISLIKLDKPPASAVAIPFATEPPTTGDLLMSVYANTGAADWIITPTSGSAGGRGPLAESRFPIAAEDPGPVFLFNISGELTAVGTDRHALPITALQSELKELEQYRVIPRRQLGVKWGPITPEERALHKLGVRAAVRVDDIFAGSLASKMGMQKGDIVLSVDKIPVAPFMMPRIQSELATRTDPITITILRDDQQIDLSFPLEKNTPPAK